jgi:hypothetical protein
MRVRFSGAALVHIANNKCDKFLPGAFGDAWDKAAMAHAAKANAANTETTHVTARAATQVATVIHARFVLRFDVQLLALHDLTGFRHVSSKGSTVEIDRTLCFS